jgi:hypothetical protein
MLAYRITEIDSRIVVSTDDKPILVCSSLEVARQAVADAQLLEALPGKLIFSRRAARPKTPTKDVSQDQSIVTHRHTTSAKPDCS